MSKDNVRRILPKPRLLAPDEDRVDESIIRQYNPAAALPKIDEDDPDILAARAAVREAERLLEMTVTSKKIALLRSAGQGLDPDRVEDLCEAERWKSGGLTDLSKERFGFIPEKFELLAQAYPEGTEDHARFIAARDKAREIYMHQIMADVIKATARYDQPSIDPVTRRSSYEDVASRLWQFYKRARLEGDPVYGNQGGRIMWAADQALRHRFYRQADESHSAGAGYQKWKIKAILPDEMESPKRDDAPAAAAAPAPTPEEL